MDTSNNKKIIEDAKITQEVEKYSPETFAREYQSLCEKMGYRLVVTPMWVATNHGSFEMTLQYSVGKLPEKVEENTEVVK